MPSDRLKNWVVRPGLGLGDLAFGASRHGTIRYLGEPEEMREDQASFNITWHYWELGVSAYFDADDDFRLGTLIIERRDAELFGLRLIGFAEERVQSLLTPFALGAAEHEVMSHAHFMSLLTYPDQELSLWFDSGRLKNIQWGYLFNEDDQPIWPSCPGS